MNQVMYKLTLFIAIFTMTSATLSLMAEEPAPTSPVVTEEMVVFFPPIPWQEYFPKFPLNFY